MMPPEMTSGPAGNGTGSKKLLDGGYSIQDSQHLRLLSPIRAPRPRAAARERRRQRTADLYVVAEIRPTSTYGMDADELRDYAAQLRREGWLDWEIRARLTDPREVVA